MNALRIVKDITAIKCSDFLTQWSALMQECEWSTPFQSPEYILTWFDHYPEFSPVFVVNHERQALTGLFTLAQHTKTKRLISAGGHQAEYQCWLERPPYNSNFFLNTISLLQDNDLLIDTLKIKYIPPNFPSVFTEQINTLESTHLATHKRPLITINETDIEHSFRKKSNKSKFSRIKKEGELKFKRLKTVEEFKQFFDEIADQYDLHQGASNDSLPFTQDHSKKAFHLALFEQYPDLFHVTVTLLSEKPIAAHIGIIENQEVHLAILAHSPLIASHSPGKLHIMQLTRLLGNEHFTTLDLTPGGDPWKERFANSHDEVKELIIYPGKSEKLTELKHQKYLNQVKSLLKKSGFSPQALKSILVKLKKITPNRIFNFLYSLRPFLTEMRFYRHTRESAIEYTNHDNEVISINKISDLLQYRPVETWQNKQSFLKSCLSRLEKHEICYTANNNNTLAHYGWLIKRQKTSLISEIGATYDFPDDSSVLYDFYTDPNSRGNGLYQKNIRRMLSDCMKDPSTRYMYISVEANNKSSRHTIEKLGFQHQDSILCFSCLGFRHTWTK